MAFAPSSSAGGSARTERLTKLQLRLGDEQFDLVSLNASEGMSQGFYITIDVISKLGSFDLLPHLGKPALIESLADGEHMRYFHGIITDGELMGEAVALGAGASDYGAYHYRLVLQPKAYFHTFGRDNRIYQDMSIRDIIKDVLGRRKIDFDEKLHGAAGNRVVKYCVQFGESDIAFVSRLMEEHGIYYFYRHEKTKHVMVLCDSPNAHGAIACGRLKYHPQTGSVGNAISHGRGDGTQTVTVWQESLRSGGEHATTMRDYDFTRSRTKIEVASADNAQHEAEDIEIYQWPGRFYSNSQGKDLAEILLEGRKAQRVSYRGSSGCTQIEVGHTFKMKDHPNDRFNAEYMVIAAHTDLASEAYHAGDSVGGTQVHFTAIPASVAFRAPLVTARPVARGPETAVVVGPKDEEIHVDKYGRIKVHFHWDRLGAMDDTSSCWIRVSQTGGLGNIIIPRVGHEVLVDFINGDPDRPIVVGRVFNDSYMPAYALPEHKTRAVWRSKTYKRTASETPSDAKEVEGDKPAANEIRFEDKTGEEQFYLHAEKDLLTIVRYRETHKVGLDQSIFVGQNDDIKIGKNRNEDVGENETIKIGKDRSEEVVANEKIKIGQNRSEEVGKDEAVKIGQNRAVQIGTNDELKVGGSMTVTVTQKITLQCGGSTIELSPSGIKITSPMIEVNSSVQTKVSGGVQLDLTGGAMANLQAGLVKIN